MSQTDLSKSGGPDGSFSTAVPEDDGSSLAASTATRGTQGEEGDRQVSTGSA